MHKLQAAAAVLLASAEVLAHSSDKPAYQSWHFMLVSVGQVICSKIIHSKIKQQGCDSCLYQSLKWLRYSCTTLFQMANQGPRLLPLCSSMNSNTCSLTSPVWERWKQEEDVPYLTNQKWHNTAIDILPVRITLRPHLSASGLENAEVVGIWYSLINIIS